MMPSSNLLKGNLKIVIDTNLFISVFVFRGKLVRIIFELVLQNMLTMYISPKLKQELNRKLRFFGVTKQVHDDVMLLLDTKGVSVDPDVAINVSRDKEDNFLLELAETANVDYLVSRDEDVLIFNKWKDTTIIMPEDFLPILRRRGLLQE
jgi:putative PIN family toxin of toxin-antitoxin system